MTKLIGNQPFQVPSNADLGSLAFQDRNSVQIGGGAVTLGASSTAGYFRDTVVSDTKPSLLLDFANGKTLDPRITYNRSSSATYYDGKTFAKAEENQVTNSQNVTSWATVSSKTISKVSFAPDGTNTAGIVIATNTNDRHIIYNFFGTGTKGKSAIYSAYFKAAGYNYAQFSLVIDGSGADTSMIVDLTNGNIGNTFTNSGIRGTVSFNVTTIGNGWFRAEIRCSLINFSTYDGIIIAPSNSSAPSYTAGSPLFTGDDISGIYVWGIQAETSRISAGMYISTTTQPVLTYIPQLVSAPPNSPRFDHNPITGKSEGLLIETNRTNIATYSQDFTNGVWSKSNSAVIANTAVAPDGTLTASKMYVTAANATMIGSFINSVSGLHTVSIYARAAELEWVGFRVDNVANDTVSFNIRSGTVGTVSAAAYAYSITPVGNDWYRISVSVSIPDSGGYRGIQITLYSADNYPVTAADAFKGIYIWGAQEEYSPYGLMASSYIPTTSAQVTRAVDYVTMTGTNFSSWYRQDEGTWFGHMGTTGTASGGISTLIQTEDGSSASTGYQALIGIANGATQTRCLAGSLAGNTANLYCPITDKTNVKLAYTYKTNEFASVADGSSPSTDSSGQLAAHQIKLNIGNAFYDGNNTLTTNGWIKKIAYYPKKLSNAELQEITL